jgi:hypothetical protein
MSPQRVSPYIFVVLETALDTLAEERNTGLRYSQLFPPAEYSRNVCVKDT